MGFKKILHVNAGDGETSYANNSGLQNIVISKTWPVLDETIKDMFIKHENAGFPKCFKIADLGCASGPNTLSVISYITDTIQDLRTKNNVNNLPPEIEVFLNDLPDNDFNNLFKSLQSVFCQKMCKLECFIYGVLGSFYERLFPSNSLHFAYSSYSLHWLSQVPEGLGKNNKENIYIAMTSPPQVFEAYAKQFRRDFSRFLSMRSHELISGGRMVLAFIGRSVVDPSTKDDMLLLTLIEETLSDMVVEGLVNNDNLHSFNMPVYAPCIQEVEAIIIKEGSFNLDKVEIVLVPWDANADCNNNMAFEKYKSVKVVADCLRAFMEPLLACHFGSSIDIDAVFHRYANKMADHLSTERSSYFTPVISLTRK